MKGKKDPFSFSKEKGEGSRRNTTEERTTGDQHKDGGRAKSENNGEGGLFQGEGGGSQRKKKQSGRGKPYKRDQNRKGTISVA